MHLIKTEILHRQQLGSHINAKITCSESACCSHGVSKFFYADNAGNVYAAWIQGDGIIQTQSWQLESTTIEQLCSIDSVYCCSVLARTSGGSVWCIRGGCNSIEEQRALKRPRIDDCEQIYEHNNLIWVQSHENGFYGLLQDGRMVDWTQGSQTILPRHIDGSFTASISATTSVESSRLDISLVQHLGLSRDKPTILIGLEDGTLWGHTTDGEGTLITQLPAESIFALHFLKLSGSSLFNALVVIGTCGTIHLYTVTQSNKLRCEEFFIPTPVFASRIAVDGEALLISLGGNVHLVEMVNVKKELAAENIALKLTRLETLKNIRQFHLDSKKSDTGDVCLLSIEVEENTISLILAQANMSEKITFDEDPKRLQDAIQLTLSELEEYEKYKLDMQKQMEDLNSRLISVNQTIYSLQRIKSQKSKLQNEENDNASPFQCDVQPLIVPPNMRHLTGSSNCFLRVRIRTPMPLKWEQWQLHINLWHQRTLLQQKSLADTQQKDSTNGLTFSIPLAGLTDDQIWIRDLPLDTKDLQLPLRVSIHLSLLLSDRTHTPMREGADLPGSPQASTPLLQHGEQQQSDGRHDSMGKNAEIAFKPVLFPLTDLLLDDLHLSFPCSDDTMKALKRNGIRDATSRLYEIMHSRRLLDNTNQYSFVHIEDVKPMFAFDDLTKATLRFIVQPHVNNSVSDTYDKFLYKFLQETQSRKHMDRILDSKERAFFHLAAHPEYPIEMRLSRDISSPNLFIISISCFSAVALLKVETSLLARAQNFVVESVDSDKNMILSEAHRELLNASADLEERYRANKDSPEFWKALKETIRHLKSHYDGLLIGPISL